MQKIEIPLKIAGYLNIHTGGGSLHQAFPAIIILSEKTMQNIIAISGNNKLIDS